jgi:hypothetical protein
VLTHLSRALWKGCTSMNSTEDVMSEAYHRVIVRDKTSALLRFGVMFHGFGAI